MFYRAYIGLQLSLKLSSPVTAVASLAGSNNSFEGWTILGHDFGLPRFTNIFLRAYSSRPQKRSKNVSIIGAIGLKGVISQYSILGATDGLTFEAYISQQLLPKLWNGAYVIMDNCSIHKGGELEKIIEAAGAKLIYLPPYSPDFSPIENCWSKVKNVLRSIGARNYLDLAKALETAFNQVSLNDIHNWFTHCCYCTALD